MKILKVFFISVAVIIVLIFVSLFIFIKTFDVNRFKPQVLQAIRQATQKEVSLGDLSLNISFPQGIVLSAQKFSLAESKDLALQYSIDVDSILLDVDVLAFLTKHQLAVSRVNLVSPNISVSRNKVEGTADPLTLPKMSAAQDSLSASVSKQNAQSAVVFPAFIVKTIRISDGTIIYADKNFPPELRINIKKFDLELTNFSLDKEFRLRSSMALFSQNPNITIQAKAQIASSTMQVRFDDVIVQADLSTCSLTEMKKDIPQLKDVPLEDKILGKVSWKADQMIAGVQGLVMLSAQGSLSDGKLKIANVGVPLDKITAQVKMTEAEIVLSDLSAALGSGRIKASGRVNDYLKSQNFSFDANIDAPILLSELVASQNLPMKIEGKILGQFKGQGKGFTPEALTQFLNGDGNMHADEAKLVDFNLLKFVLDKISIIPNLAQNIEASMPDSYKEKLNRQDTIFKQVKADLKIEQGSIVIPSLIVDADDFVLNANGRINFNQTAEFHSDFYINEELSSQMISSVSQLSYLLEEDKRIHIPLSSYEGSLSKFIIYPDLEKIGKKIVKTGAKQELKKAIFKALKIGDDSENNPEAAGSGDAQSSGQKSPKATVENILNTIFK
ncbi:MAG: AsmA family protein [Candidatus Omnitrophica bacterium]|nr:AsmA family protein [Candidatus Omnitrophota bacterium]